MMLWWLKVPLLSTCMALSGPSSKPSKVIVPNLLESPGCKWYDIFSCIHGYSEFFETLVFDSSTSSSISLSDIFEFAISTSRDISLYRNDNEL